MLHLIKTYLRQYGTRQTIKQHSVPNVATLVAVALMLWLSLVMQPEEKLSAGPVESTYQLIDQQAIPANQTGGVMPNTINYQACLTTPDGDPINDQVDLTLTLYTTPTGGSSVWHETHTDITVQDCQLQLMLGSQAPIPVSVWHQKPLYLGVKINNDPEMTPRERLSEATPTICTGRTNPDGTGWKDYRDVDGELVGIYIKIDTSHCGFTLTPTYITSLNGDSWHWDTIGSSSIYFPTSMGFEIYLKSDSSGVNSQIANDKNWHIQWIGVQQ